MPPVPEIPPAKPPRSQLMILPAMRHFVGNERQSNDGLFVIAARPEINPVAVCISNGIHQHIPGNAGMNANLFQIKAGEIWLNGLSHQRR